MPYELFLALRYLRMRRGRRVAKWTALAAVTGIACGVAALIVALALANGFRDELRDKILRGTAHVTLTREGGAALAEVRAAAGKARAVGGVSDAAPTTYAGALLSGPEGAAYAVLRGVDAESPRALEAVRRTLVAGAVEPLARARAGAGGAQPAEPSPDEEPAAIIVGEELAARTGLSEPGAEGWLLSGDVRPGAAEFAPRARRVRVAGVFRSGLYDYDAAWAYLALEEAARAGAATADAAVVSVEVRDIYQTGEAARALADALGPGWSAVDWREANRPLFAALELERRVVALIILLVMAVAALNITTTLALVVVERRSDIAVLGALGARPRSVMAVFVIEGALVGLAGAAAGVALGLAACAAGEHFELVRLPADVYSIAAVPFRPQWRDVLLPALAAFALSVVATLYPARQAARTRPAEALRYE
ncbi:MAG TPA: FtsX-like permease family protein [Pyrinomonadaceae bacterium]|nr:FtsX-like permease family protein [Pyrinomonadaceae bacterium]